MATDDVDDKDDDAEKEEVDDEAKDEDKDEDSKKLDLEDKNLGLKMSDDDLEGNLKRLPVNIHYKLNWSHEAGIPRVNKIIWKTGRTRVV